MQNSMMRNRVAIVTGAGSGLGRSHALMLAQQGARVVVNDLGAALDGRGRSRQAADAVVAEIVAAGGEAVANYEDVIDEAGARRIIEAAMDHWGRIDALVNNAGIVRDKTFAKMELSDFRLVMEIHLMGSVNCTKAAWGQMRAQRYGRVVMTTSGTGLWGNFGQSNYGAAKAALIGLMNTLSLEGARDDILVNSVSPIAATRMTAAMMPAAAVPFLKPEYISAAVTYLCSEACTLNGAIMSAGAGYYALARMEEAAGVFLAADQTPTPELVAANLGRMGDFGDAGPMSSSVEYVAKALSRFGETGT